jgi:hypothetical protein
LNQTFAISENFNSGRACGQFFSVSEMEAALEQCDNKSPGEDVICVSVLKVLLDEVKVYLLNILNDILKSGSIPGSWQKINVITILKLGKEPNKACVRKLFKNIILTRMDY